MNYSKLNSPVISNENAVSKTGDKKVTIGKVKKETRRKFFDEMFTEDMETVKEHIIWDVILPTIKDGLRNTLISIINSFFGIGSSRSNNGTNYSFKRANSESLSKPMLRAEPRTAIDTLIYDTKADAENVLNSMEECINSYGTVSVAQYYTLSGYDSNASDWNYGWTDLSSARIKLERNGAYSISFPRAMVIE